MKNRKIKLTALKIESFVTETNKVELETIKGGRGRTKITAIHCNIYYGITRTTCV